MKVLRPSYKTMLHLVKNVSYFFYLQVTAIVSF
jgi:hypothetical protein